MLNNTAERKMEKIVNTHERKILEKIDRVKGDVSKKRQKGKISFERSCGVIDYVRRGTTLKSV